MKAQLRDQKVITPREEIKETDISYSCMLMTSQDRYVPFALSFTKKESNDKWMLKLRRQRSSSESLVKKAKASKSNDTIEYKLNSIYACSIDSEDEISSC